MRSKLESLKSVAEGLSDRPGDDRTGVLDPPEQIIEGAESDTQADERVLDVPIVWAATHSIGPFTVQERSFVNGLRYWVEENGKRRRPTAANPLRKFAPKPETARAMFLDRTAFSLLMAARFSEYSERAEDQFGNTAQRVDDDHVLLSLHDRAKNADSRYLIQIPVEFEVVGAKCP